MVIHKYTFNPCSDPQSKMADKGENDASFSIKLDVKVTP